MSWRSLVGGARFHPGEVLASLLLVFLTFTVGAAPAAAQLTTGTIVGTIKDNTGGALPGAEVTVVHTGTGLSRTLFTNEAGRYEAPNLQIGAYDVTAAMQGFSTKVNRGITLTAGQNAVIDFTLEIGALAQEIVVTGDAPLLETTSATVRNLIDNKTVEDLPLINRDLTQLTFLQPGVVKVPSSGTQGVFGGMGDKFTVAGARGTQNLYLLDGVSNADLSGNPQGASGSYAGAETVQEIQIVTNNYSAEYRSAAGGIVSAVTKSGTNTPHGSAYLFHRNDSLEAIDYFQEAFDTGKPDFTRNQWGGSFGGPIVRNKLFFFGSYEGLKEETGKTDTVTTLTDDARRGILPTGAVAVNPAVLPYLALYPVPGQGNTVIQDNGNGTIQVANSGTNEVDDDFVLGKVDYQMTSTQNLSFTYSWNEGARTPYGMLTEVGDTNVFGTTSGRDILGIKHTIVLGNTSLNEFHFGFSDTSSKGDVPLTSTDFTNIAFLPDRTLVGQLNVSGLSAVGFRVDFSDYRQRGWSFRDSLAFVRGNHSFRAGGEYNYYKYDVESCSRGCNGLWAFPSLARFLQGTPNDFQVMLPGSDGNRRLAQSAIGAYLQDNWRLKENLTLNLGLRYEFATVPEELDGKQGSLIDPFNPAPDNFGVTIGPFFTNPTKKSFSPRVGFAWAPGSANKWSVRGGFGVFYEHPMLYNIRTTLQELPPFTLVGRLREAAAPNRRIDFPNAFFTQQALLSGTPNIRTMEYDLDQSTMLRWSTTVQRDLGRGFVMSADYTGSRGYNLWQQTLPNIRQWQGFPEQPASSLDKFFPGGTPLIFPAFGEMRIQYANANLWYRGLSLGLQKRLAEGFQMQSAFTWSRARDEGSGVTSGGDELPQSQRGIYAWDMELKRGPSAYDVRKAFSTNLSYELPFGRDATGVAGALARGWQVNGVFTLTDGYPVSVTDSNTLQEQRIGDTEDLRVNLVPGGDPNPVLGGPDQYYDISQFAPSTLGFFGNAPKGSVITPGLVKVDLSVFKTFSFATSNRIQFRLEIFNLFNRANFATPDMGLVLPDGTIDPEAGQITSLRTPARQAQLGLRWVF
jgi:hypothetical protein